MIDDTKRGCIEIFRDITGMNGSRRGSAVSDEQILSDPITSFDIDSLETMEFIMGVEERFDVQLDEEAVNRCSNIAELAALVAAARRV
jgi:acyl carrier protein